MLDYKQLNVTTFNCKNIRTCGPIFEKFAKTEDMVLIQEHWLFKCQLDLLNELNENFMSAGKSVDYTDPIPPIQIPRGYGGVAIFWKKDIDHIVNSLEIGNQRIICIELLAERPTLVICVYMPCNGETDSYHSYVECIEQLQEIIYTYQGTHEIIIGGDFNENAVVNNNSKRSSCFHTFIRENDLMTRNTEHTFIHPNGKDSSTIDFFLYKQRTDKSITKIERVESYSESVSDHYPVSMTMNVNFKKRSLKATSSIKTVTRIKWNSVDKQQYASIAAKKVSNMNDVIMSSDIDNAVSTVNQLLTDSAKECFPARKKGTKKPKLKVMNPKIYHAIHEKKKAFHQWKMNGRPNDPTNFYLLEKKLKTVELRRQIRIETARRRHAEKMSIVNAKQSDNALFHRIIRNQRGKCHKFIDELHVGSQSYSGDEILSGWYEHFKELSSKKVNEKFDLNFMKQVEEEVAIIYMICLDSSVDPKPVTDEEIKKAIASLNRGKAPDVYGVTAEHVYYGGHAVTNCVQTLINNILFNKEIPSSMKLGILNPIFKYSKSEQSSHTPGGSHQRSYHFETKSRLQKKVYI